MKRGNAEFFSFGLEGETNLCGLPRRLVAGRCSGRPPTPHDNPRATRLTSHACRAMQASCLLGMPVRWRAASRKAT